MGFADFGQCEARARRFGSCFSDQAHCGKFLFDAGVVFQVLAMSFATQIRVDWFIQMKDFH